MNSVKRIFSLSIIFCLTIFFVTGCGNKKENKPGDDENKENYNTNQGVIGEKDVNGLKLTNTSLKSDEYSAELITLVSNMTENNIQVGEFEINIKDKSGNTIITTTAYVGGEVPANDSRIIKTNFDINLDNAHSIEYKVIN